MNDSTHRITVTRRNAIMPSGDAGQACLVVIYPAGVDLGRRFDFREQTQRIGRSADAEILLDREQVSRRHARIERRDENWAVVDLGSKNGTFVNGARVDDHMLEDGDLIVIGDTIFKFLTGANIELSYHKELYRMTIVDVQTHAFNKRYLQEQLERELARCSRTHRPLSLVLFDIDHFKDVNDTYGHLAGDHVLRDLASRMLFRIRKTDLLARYGGEEFALMLPETTNADAALFAEQLRLLVEQRPFVYEGHEIRATISGGVATATEEIPRDEFIGRADSNLFRAKRSGRNQVVG